MVEDVSLADVAKATQKHLKRCALVGLCVAAIVFGAIKLFVTPRYLIIGVLEMAVYYDSSTLLPMPLIDTADLHQMLENQFVGRPSNPGHNDAYLSKIVRLQFAKVLAGFNVVPIELHVMGKSMESGREELDAIVAEVNKSYEGYYQAASDLEQRYLSFMTKQIELNKAERENYQKLLSTTKSQFELLFLRAQITQVDQALAKLEYDATRANTLQRLKGGKPFNLSKVYSLSEKPVSPRTWMFVFSAFVLSFFGTLILSVLADRIKVA